MAENPSENREAVRHALGRLCTKGLVPWYVREKAEVLLSLRCVADRVTEGGGQLDDVAALAEILRELVSRIRHQPAGQILWIVMNLDGAQAGKKVDERRRVAGEQFRDGIDSVKASTIRQHHEPRALDRLTEMLLQYEAQHPRAAGQATRP